MLKTPPMRALRTWIPPACPVSCIAERTCIETPVAPTEAEPEPIRESEPARQDAATDAPAPVEEPAAAPAEGGDEEDLLEETPDFLQDTPDHDRLWFEQRPPRDFDFDG